MQSKTPNRRRSSSVNPRRAKCWGFGRMPIPAGGRWQAGEIRWRRGRDSNPPKNVNSTTCRATDGTEGHEKHWKTAKRIAKQIADPKTVGMARTQPMPLPGASGERRVVLPFPRKSSASTTVHWTTLKCIQGIEKPVSILAIVRGDYKIQNVALSKCTQVGLERCSLRRVVVLTEQSHAKAIIFSFVLSSTVNPTFLDYNSTFARYAAPSLRSEAL